MKVLFLMFVFPDINKSFNMYTTLAEEFVNHGHDVVVLAPGNNQTAIKNEMGINVLRVKTMPIKNVSNFLKGISNLILPLQYNRALKKFYPLWKPDLVVIPTPPITLVDLAVKIKNRHNSRLYLILRDIFPQNAVDLGFIKKGGLLYKYFRKKEIKLYQNADYIGCMSQGNIDYVLRHNQVDPKKLHVLFNFQKLYHGYGHDNSSLKKKYGIENKFVVVFGGNMGKPQQLENVLALAKHCQQYPDVVFLLLGEGLYVENLKKSLRKERIRNVKIIPTIPKQEYQDLLSVCQIGLISLHQNFTIPNIPSKALDYFNVGIPILASIDRATDFNKILDETGAGLWSYAGDIPSLVENFKKLHQNPDLRKQMGQKARYYFEKNLVPEIAYRTIVSKVDTVSE